MGSVLGFFVLGGGGGSIRSEDDEKFERVSSLQILTEGNHKAEDKKKIQEAVI